MAPLFSALVVVPGAVLLLALAFAVARFFQPASVAIRIALVFVVGSAIGGVATLVGLAFLVSSTLSESWQVIAYLVSLGVGALLGGALLVVFCIKRRVLTLRSSGPPQAASA
jgi:ABC-type transport system involved in multi-copper enzyme maturation permease subunit